MAGKGFTLLELLVVISIIGLLSSIVLASLNSARTRGADAAIRGNMNTVRVQGVLYFDTHQTFGGTFLTHGCTSPGSGGNRWFAVDATTQKAVQSLISITGSAEDVRCAIGGTGSANPGYSYAMAVRLRSEEAWWCVDSSGNAHEIDGATTPTLNQAPTGNALAVCP